MIHIRDIDYVVLRAINLDEMLAFDTNVPGCGVKRRQNEMGLVQLCAGSSLVDLVPVDSKLGKACTAGIMPRRVGNTA